MTVKKFARELRTIVVICSRKPFIPNAFGSLVVFVGLTCISSQRCLSSRGMADVRNNSGYTDRGLQTAPFQPCIGVSKETHVELVVA